MRTGMAELTTVFAGVVLVEFLVERSTLGENDQAEE